LNRWKVLETIDFRPTYAKGEPAAVVTPRFVEGTRENPG
jgi:hypothetical protein